MHDIGRTKVWCRLSEIEKGQLLSRPQQDLLEQQVATVSEILAKVKYSGDEALRDYTLRYDRVDLPDAIVSVAELDKMAAKVDPAVAKAIDFAFERIHKFHREQVIPDMSFCPSDGVALQRLSRPIEKVGIYVPGGTAPLPSTVLMAAIPAAIAGCNDRVLVSPPSQQGLLAPEIYYAAKKCGIDSIVKVGGAQAIASLAYGTKTVPKVYKIFGPGNSWVTIAKQLVAKDPEGAAIDMPAGPSEVLVICDETARADFVAWDLLSQAEHGIDSQVVLVSTSAAKIQDVRAAISDILPKIERSDIAARSLAHARFIEAESLKEAMDISNSYAPEHLIIQTDNPDALVPGVSNAGSVFLGSYTPESVGDYASGTNHILPTGGWARSYSGLSVDSFLKKITVQKLGKVGLLEIGPHVEKLATAEGLSAHKGAVTVRLEAIRERDKG